jgi:hypothetical protein
VTKDFPYLTVYVANDKSNRFGRKTIIILILFKSIILKEYLAVQIYVGSNFA